MSDYIEREAALAICQKEYEERVKMADWCGDTVAWNIAADVSAIPAADVAPVRHGKWIPSDYTGDCCYTCSECGFERDAYLLDARNYCPNCGCCMLGGGEDDLDSIPVVDAEPVVHCADCIHLMFSDCYGECKRGYLGGIVRPDDYCSRGERKEDNT